MQEIQLIDSDLIGNLVKKAQTAERKRTNFNFHEQKEVYQRFLNVLSKDTYIPPHRHLSDPKPETFIILEGEIGFLIFDENGEVKETHKLSANGPKRGIDLQPGVWHSLVCLSETAVCFEGKSGPYDPTVDKEFHPNYPLESDPKFTETIKSFESLFL